MRLGNYEILKSNQWCYQIYSVMPYGYDNSKSKFRIADDGRALRSIDCYPTTLAAAVRRKFMLIDEIDDVPDATRLALLVEESERRVSELAERIEAAVAKAPEHDTEKWPSEATRRRWRPFEGFPAVSTHKHKDKAVKPPLRPHREVDG